MKSSMSMEFLDESTREIIMNYEKRRLEQQQQQPSTSFSPSFTGSSSGGHVYVEERSEKIAGRLCTQMPTLIPMFDPFIRPPNIPPHSIMHGGQPAQINKQNAQQQQPIINLMNEDNNIGEKNIKREALDTEMPDEIPSFQSPPTINEKDLQSTKTEAEFHADEDKKRKQALLWGLCQEELTVTSAIGNANKRIENIRQKIEQQKKTLASEEGSLEKLKAKRAELEERRIFLLKSVEKND